ncbi:hypothetical protein ACIU1J_19080 [Azospirillum doebereinerae]|uniref:hypothetical protein n=1 Tax=Azospirillum doebereinerae TaxID=92933 RepID=UPI0038507535
MVPPSAPDTAAARRALASAGVFGALANLLVLCAPLYVGVLYDSLLQDRGNGGALLLALAALGLFGIHTALDAARSQALARSGSARRGAGPDRAWLLDAVWIPVHLLVLAWVHPYLGAMALAGVAALAALAAAGELSEQPLRGGHSTAFRAGLRFCGVVYQALALGVGAALVLHDALAPGLFLGGVVVVLTVLPAAARAAGARRAGPAAVRPV